MPRPSLAVLDVRPVRPHAVAPVVRAAVERLDVGDAFVLVDDCDPRSVCEAVTARVRVPAQWDLLSTSGGCWCVRIRRPGNG